MRISDWSSDVCSSDLHRSIRLFGKLGMVDEIKAKVAARIGIIGPASDLDQPAPAVEEAVARLAVTEIGTPLIAALRGGRPPYLARNGKGERFVRAFAQKEIGSANV